MEAIFECHEGEQGRSELFKAANGIMWSTGAEARFSAGHFVVVPALPENPTNHEMDAWETSDVKHYKIQVLNPKHPEMDKKLIGTTERYWREVDGEPVQFKTTFRPRARYLYFAYCATMLRQSFTKGQRLDIAQQEIGKRFWGTRGRYMHKSMLLGERYLRWNRW